MAVVLAVALGATMLTGCKQKKQSQDIIVRKTETPKPQAPIRMQDYNQVKDIQWLDRAYQVDIRRTADDSLRMVKDETGPYPPEGDPSGRKRVLQPDVHQGVFQRLS